jgi:hypothetical protein
MPLLLSYYWEQFFFIISKIKKNYKVFFFYLILVSFFPTIITFENFPNSRRSFLTVYFLTFLIAYGIWKIWEKVSLKKVFLSITIAVLCLNFAYFWFYYQFHSSFLASHARNYFYKQVAQFINKNKNNYQTFKIYSYSEQPYIFILFFNKVDPKKYQQFSKNNWPEKTFSATIEWGFDKYIFTPQECPQPKKGEVVLTEYAKCKNYLESKQDKKLENIKILDFAYSPYNAKEFVYYTLAD